MSRRFADLSVESLTALAAALRTSSLAPPYTALAMRRFVPELRAVEVASELQQAAAEGFEPGPLGILLGLLAQERIAHRQGDDRIELVWSGPEAPNASTRDTAVVVDELFRRARRSIVVSGYALYQGRHVFRELAANADRNEELRVRMFLNVQRGYGDGRSDNELLRSFAERFRRDEWPGDRLPEVYYDPRALSLAPGPRACLHAKCVVIDESTMFVTSANFTEAAQERNIEVGIVLDSPLHARTLVTNFEVLVGSRSLVRIAGLG